MVAVVLVRQHIMMSVYNTLLAIILCTVVTKGMDKTEMKIYREKAKAMFYHGYNGYLTHGFPYDELKPISCTGHDTWGSYHLTLVDSLDTLLIMGNTTEFLRVVKLLKDEMKFEKDINVSVFETNIRVIGGLLAAHLLMHRTDVKLDPGWPCEGALLDLARQAAEKLLPAFNTSTSMPYGTVNLLNGVPEGETTITCTASIGTFILEFATLTHLTGDVRFENVAMKALDSLYNHTSSKGLVGNHIDISSGKWTAVDSGIGAGVDSYFEYLVKGGIMFSKTKLLDMFTELNKNIHKHLKFDDWYIWAHMDKGSISLPVFQSLDAYWPGLQTLLGNIGEASRTLSNYHSVWRQFGFTPEFYQIGPGETFAGREGYPLRPELIESTMYLYQATKDPYYLEVGRDILESIERHTKTPCGYATIRNVNTHELEDRMESFFLAETTKYLYLLFDENNFIHRSDGSNHVTRTGVPSQCLIGSLGYIFNTEAHPLDIAAVNCCKNFNRISRNFQSSAKGRLEDYQRTEDAEYLTGKYKCKARPYFQRFFTDGAYLEDKDDLFW
eukprot:Seg1075.8 transcript_id=Seg1075.8/GoldUCD/mRNA.D3Y31 product="ER degradation-enhancing alpha-mannosidase-like protein 2" protein_id=Seg1075.8/GoldUCD/D3Y31